MYSTSSIATSVILSAYSYISMCNAPHSEKADVILSFKCFIRVAIPAVGSYMVYIISLCLLTANVQIIASPMYQSHDYTFTS